MPARFLGFTFCCLIAFCFLSGCGPNDCQKLEAKIRKMIDDQTIDSEEWTLLSAQIDENAKLYERAGCTFSDDASIRDFVTQVANKRSQGNEVSIAFEGGSDQVVKPVNTAPLRFSFYLESSGSMFPYAKGSTSFRNAIYDLLTRIPDNRNEANKMYYISNGAFEMDGGVREFIKTRDPYEMARNNPKIKSGSTDLTEIFDIMLEETETGNIGILVSDCIYSIKGGDASSDLDQLEFLTKDVFQSKARSHSVLVLQMNSEYDGIYYDYLNGKHPYNGERPYYMVFIGKNNDIQKMLETPQFQDLAAFNTLKGFQDFALFSPAKAIDLPYYSILTSTNKVGEFRPDRDLTEGNALKGIVKAEPRKRNQESNFEFSAALDLSPIYASDSYLTDISNYTVEADNDFSIVSIQRLDPTIYKASDKRYIGSATHLITFHSDKLSVSEQMLSLRLKREKASWFESAGVSDDRAFETDASLQDKTFGLSYWVNGIQRAYQPVGADDFFSIQFSIKK